MRSLRRRHSARPSTSHPTAEALELGEGLEGDPALAFRRTLGMFATGVTVLTTRVGEQVHGMTANAFMSVSLQPPLVLISIDRRARMGALLHQGTRFGVSVLEASRPDSRTASPGASPTTLPRQRSRSSTRPRSSRVRSRTSSRASCARTGAATTRSSSGRSSSPATGRVGRFSSTADATSGSSRIRASSRCSPRAARADSRARARSASTRTASRSCGSGERGSELLLVLEGTVRVERPGLLADARCRRAHRRDRGPRPGRRPHRRHLTRSALCGAWRSRDDALLAALEADPRAAIALIEVLAARFRETA